MTNLDLNSTDIAQLLELLQDYRDGVASGEIIPNQSLQDELADTDELLGKLRAAQH